MLRCFRFNWNGHRGQLFQSTRGTDCTRAAIEFWSLSLPITVNSSCWYINNCETQDDNNNWWHQTKHCEINGQSVTLRTSFLHLRTTSVSLFSTADSRTKQVRFISHLISMCSLQRRVWIPYGFSIIFLIFLSCSFQISYLFVEFCFYFAFFTFISILFNSFSHLCLYLLFYSKSFLSHAI